MVSGSSCAAAVAPQNACKESQTAVRQEGPSSRRNARPIQSKLRTQKAEFRLHSSTEMANSETAHFAVWLRF